MILNVRRNWSIEGKSDKWNLISSARQVRARVDDSWMPCHCCRYWSLIPRYIWMPPYLLHYVETFTETQWKQQIPLPGCPICTILCYQGVVVHNIITNCNHMGFFHRKIQSNIWESGIYSLHTKVLCHISHRQNHFVCCVWFPIHIKKIQVNTFSVYAWMETPHF